MIILFYLIAHINKVLIYFWLNCETFAFLCMHAQGCGVSQVAKKFTLFSQHLGVEIMPKVQILAVTGFMQIVVVGDVTLCGL